MKYNTMVMLSDDAQRSNWNTRRVGGSSPVLSSRTVTPVLSVLDQRAVDERVSEERIRNGYLSSGVDVSTMAENRNVVDGYLSVEFTCATACVPAANLESVMGEGTSFLDAHRLVGGSGIGLKWRISQDIVKRHGGVLVVRAGEAVGTGLFVQMYLPCVRQKCGVDDLSRQLSSPPPPEDRSRHSNTDRAVGDGTVNDAQSPQPYKLSKLKRVIQPRPLDLARPAGCSGYAEVGDVRPTQKETRNHLSRIKIFPSLAGRKSYPVVSRGVTDASPTSEFMWINVDTSHRHPRSNPDREAIESKGEEGEEGGVNSGGCGSNHYAIDEGRHTVSTSPRLNAVRGVWDPRCAGSWQEGILDSNPTVYREESGTTERVQASVTVGSIASTLRGRGGSGGLVDSRGGDRSSDPIVPFEDVSNGGASEHWSRSCARSSPLQLH
eukprot:gene2755-3359_t